MTDGNMLLAQLPDSNPSPATFGVIVIVLLQLAQFFFAWRKDMHRENSAKKEDLAALRKELRDEIKEVDGKLQAMKTESARAREELLEKINDGAVEIASVKTGQEMMNQTLSSLVPKIDLIARRR